MSVQNLNVLFFPYQRNLRLFEYICECEISKANYFTISLNTLLVSAMDTMLLAQKRYFAFLTPFIAPSPPLFDLLHVVNPKFLALFARRIQNRLWQEFDFPQSPKWK